MKANVMLSFICIPPTSRLLFLYRATDDELYQIENIYVRPHHFVVTVCWEKEAHTT